MHDLQLSRQGLKSFKLIFGGTLADDLHNAPWT